jgi:hypothetical protein
LVHVDRTSAMETLTDTPPARDAEAQILPEVDKDVKH